jgi:hypothetical protein
MHAPATRVVYRNLDRLMRLVPISPDLPAAEDTLAGG